MISRDVLAEIVDVGVWTFGLVALAAISWIAVKDVGVIGLAFPVVAIAILGVTGRAAVASVDDVLGPRLEDEEGSR